MIEGIQRVIDHTDGPLLILGGPGTGKTYGLEQRFLRLSQSEGLAPHRILLLCGNRRYAVEAKQRLVWKLPHRATIEIPVYTWHALAYHVVTRYYPVLGYSESPVLLTGPEQWGTVREMLASEHPSGWPVWGERLQDRGFVDEIADFVLRVEQRMVELADLEALMSHRADWREVVQFYGRYQERLKQGSRLDYAGLITSAVNLLSKDGDVKGALRKRFPHVLVDDGQELSHAQICLLKGLSTESLTVAADPNSGIETFRGAEPDWVFGFEAQFGPHTTVELGRSYRIGSPLVEASSDLIARNHPDHQPLMTAPAEHSTIFEARLYTSVAEEAEAVARELRHLHLAEHVAWADMAVLISQPAYLLAPMEGAFDRWEVPYHAMSADRPLSSNHVVASFLGLVKAALRSERWEQSLPSVLTSSLVGLGYCDLRRLERQAWTKRRSLLDVIAEDPAAMEFRQLRDLVIENQSSADECFWQIYSASTFLQDLTQRAISDVDDPANLDLDALVALSHSLGRFVERRHGHGSIKEYLTEASRADFGGDSWLAPSSAEGSDRVSMLSFHAARGRQWHTVVVAGCLDAWIPKGKRAQGLFDPFALEIAEAADREVEAIADDRRTFYVAATRATDRTIFTVSTGSGGRGRPSRFLGEFGAVPEALALEERPALTLGEMSSRLRRTLARADTSPTEKVAAAVALAEVPGTDPTRWYGRWGWTEGSVPLAKDAKLRTSYSRLGVFQNCGLQYLLQTVLGLDPSSTHSMKFGTWIHALIEAVHSRVINDIPTLRREYARLFDERVFPNATIAAQFRRDGEKMLRNLWENEFTQDDVLVEHNFEFLFEGSTLRGRIDRIDTKGGVLKLTDYKTAKWTPSTREAQESLQLAIYFLAARQDPKLKELGHPGQARLVYPGASWADGSMKVLNQTAEQADAVLDGLPDLLQRVIAEDFNPSVEANCHFCRMRPLCPIWPEGVEVQ